MLDPSSCGSNLVLSNGNLVVTNTVNKKWNAVRSTSSFSSGIHSWEVHIDKCVSKNIFVGVVSSNDSIDNYVGSDRYGWGYLANKAIWHNKGKMRSYGELFRQGDTISVKLDMDQGTLSFGRNGKDLGVAVEGLSGDMYPAFSLYNQDDQLSISQQGARAKGRTSSSSTYNAKSSSLNHRSLGTLGTLGIEEELEEELMVQNLIAQQHGRMLKHSSSEGSFARRRLHAMNKSLKLLQCLSSSSTLSSTLPNHKLPTLNTSLPENVTTTELHSFLQLLNANSMIRAMTKNGDVVVLNSNNELCFHLFGYHINDVLCTSKGKSNMLLYKTSEEKRKHGNSFNVFLQSHF